MVHTILGPLDHSLEIFLVHDLLAVLLGEGGVVRFAGAGELPVHFLQALIELVVTGHWDAGIPLAEVETNHGVGVERELLGREDNCCRCAKLCYKGKGNCGFICPRSPRECEFPKAESTSFTTSTLKIHTRVTACLHNLFYRTQKR